MKILYYDCFCGISGDMNLGALVDIGVDQDYLINELKKLKINEEFELKIEKKIKKGIIGTKVDVLLKSHNHDSHHHHRTLKDISKIINSSDLSSEIKNSALNMFMEVAKAEAKVHGKSIDEIHFHEVGATDSIIDLVGAAICIEYLKVDKVMSSSVQLGGGFVNCAHGKIPVPAPATVEILQCTPIKTGLVESETTTPTGAAILISNVNDFKDEIDFKIKKIGYGLGTKEFDIPNVLRVYLGKTIEEEIDHVQKRKQYILETNIDDMNPELYTYVEEKLLRNGAKDVYRTPIIMKKGRSAIKFSVLYSLEDEERIMDIIFKETTSIGYRKYEVEKVMLDREFIKIKTKFGEVNVKKTLYKSHEKYKAEYEECKKKAEEYNVPIAEVYKAVQDGEILV